jgi:DNA-binding transcriptional ArsR family regulator
MWAIAHPIRFRIWELVREGPSTASRLARRLGESRGSMSYHMRFLGRAGVIEEMPEAGTARERWWRRPEALVIAQTDADPERARSTRVCSRCSSPATTTSVTASSRGP